MDERFEISVTYSKEHLIYDARLFISSYVYKVEVIVDTWIVWFVKDNKGDGWKPVLKSAIIKNAKKPPQHLLKLISQSLENKFNL
jgi:hypothetical protein